MNEPVLCPVCQDPARLVLEAVCGGAIIRLNPSHPAPGGLWAVTRDGEVLKARRLLTVSSALFEGETRYDAHNCTRGLGEVA